MKERSLFLCLPLVLGLLSIGSRASSETKAGAGGLLIDDFSSELSALGTRWEGFTDRVMGGRSDMSVGLASEGGRQYLKMSGNVSLANNGGFIQARLMLEPKGFGAFDAASYSGLRLNVRGKGNDYYVFLRTTANLAPWSFFMASIPLKEEWSEVSIPWSAFKKGDFGSFFGLNVKNLSSIAVVAYKKEFSAQIDLREIAFYRE